MTSLGTYLCIWEKNGSKFWAIPDDISRIDAGVQQYLDTGRDSLLCLTAYSGGDYFTKASNINCWRLSSPESRHLNAKQEAMEREEQQAHKAEFGWVDA